MKISKMTVASLLFCAASLACYYGYMHFIAGAADQTYPVITMEQEEASISVQDGEEALLEGVTAYDEKDGDVTDSIVIESVSRFVNGRRIVTYAAFDSDNHVTKMEREISYTDYEAPKFYSEEGFRFRMGAESLVDTLEAVDCIDGDISKSIKASPGYYVSTGAAGTYAFQYQVANSAGDVEYLPVTVEIYDPADPEVFNFELKDYIVYTEKGKKIDARSYLDVDNPWDYSINESKVDYDTEGTYEITYKITVGDRKGTNRLVVVVR